MPCGPHPPAQTLPNAKSPPSHPKNGGETMSTISVQTTPSYPILIERGLLRKAGQTLLPLHPPCRAALLSDDTVFSLYGNVVMDSLKGAGYRPVRISLPAGETGKTWAVLGDLLERLAEEGLTRGDLLVVLGGGSACDVGGLAAALYHRGMDVAYLATTLLAGVDAAIGGKTDGSLVFYTCDEKFGRGHPAAVGRPHRSRFSENATPIGPG